MQEGFTYYTISFTFEKVAEPEKQLQHIIIDVQYYLYRFGRSRLYLALGKKYYQKCCCSWARVSAHIEKFLRAPRYQYSSLMMVLDQEIRKFTPDSFYGKQLKALEMLFSTGPHFNGITN